MGPLLSTARSCLVGAVAILLAASAVPASAQVETIVELQRQVEELKSRDRYDEAVAPARRIVELAGQLPNNAPHLASAHTLLGDVLIHASEKVRARHADAEKSYRQALAIVEQRAGGDQLEIAQALHNVADALSWQGKHADGEKLEKRAREIRERLTGPGSAETAESIDKLGVFARAQERYDEAETLIKQALELREKLFPPEHPSHHVVAESLHVLAGIHMGKERYRDAAPILKRTIEIREKAFPAGHRFVGGNYDSLAEAYRHLDRLDEAERLAQRALEVRAARNGPRSESAAGSHERLAAVLISRGRFDEAEKELETAITILREQPETNFKRIAHSQTRLAHAYSDRGRLAEAYKLHQDALAVRRQHDKPTVAFSLTSLGIIERALSRYADAEKSVRDGIQLRRVSPGQNSVEYAVSLGVLAGIFTDQERFKEAEPLAKEALDIRLKNKQLGGASPTTAIGHVTYAAVLRGLERYADAEEHYKRAIAIRIQIYGGDHQAVAAVISDLAGVMSAQGRVDEAEQTYHKAEAIYRGRGGQGETALATCLINRAVLYRKQGRSAEAESLLREAVGLRTRNLGNRDRRTLQAQTALADLLLDTNKLAEAEPLLTSVLDTRRGGAVGETVETADTMQRLSRLRRLQGDLAEATRQLEGAIRIRLAVLKPGHSSVVTARSVLEELLRKQSRFDEARTVLALNMAEGRAAMQDVTVYFGTNRSPVRSVDGLDFDANWQDGLIVGRAIVSVTKPRPSGPTQRSDGGHDEKQPLEESNEHIEPVLVSRNVREDNPVDFIEAARTQLRAARGPLRNNAFVLVHGFNVTFAEAAKDAGKLAYDMGFEGSAFVFSWPSAGNALMYGHDKNAAINATDPLRAFLLDVVARTGATRIHIVAHSMGNFALLQALEKIGASATPGRFPVGEVLLVAPDVDRPNFARIVKKLTPLGGAYTLYASSNDRALQLSRFVGGLPAGLINSKHGPMVIDGVDTVDITKASLEWIGLNHSAFKRNKRLHHDIRIIMEKGEHPPHARSNLFEKEEAKGYWRMLDKLK